MDQADAVSAVNLYHQEMLQPANGGTAPGSTVNTYQFSEGIAPPFTCYCHYLHPLTGATCRSEGTSTRTKAEAKQAAARAALIAIAAARGKPSLYTRSLERVVHTDSVTTPAGVCNATQKPFLPISASALATMTQQPGSSTDSAAVPRRPAAAQRSKAAQPPSAQYKVSSLLAAPVQQLTKHTATGVHQLMRLHNATDEQPQPTYIIRQWPLPANGNVFRVEASCISVDPHTGNLCNIKTEASASSLKQAIYTAAYDALQRVTQPTARPLSLADLADDDVITVAEMRALLAAQQPRTDE